MNDKAGRSTQNALYIEKSDPHVMDYLTMLARHRIAVVAMTLGFGLLFLFFTFVMRFSFTSMATLLPPEKQQMGGLMSFLAGSGALDLMKTQENPALDLFRNVLESRTLAEEIARDPRVRRYYSAFDTSHKAITGMVQRSLTAEALRNGVMTVEVEVVTHWMPDDVQKDSAKVLSAYMANLFISTLDRFNRERLMTSARNTRIFVEKEYQTRMATLDSAYARLQQFQETHKAISLPDQLTSTVSAAAELAAQVQQLEIQLNVERRDLNASSTRIELLQAQLDEARRALQKFDDGSAGSYVLGLRAVPSLARDYARLTREIKLLEAVTAYLRQQLEQEKISEQRNLPSLQVLDSATPPDRKSSPKRLAMLLLGLTGGFVLSMLYVGFRRFTESVREDRSERRRFKNFVFALRHGTNARFEVAAGPADQASSVRNSHVTQD